MKKWNKVKMKKTCEVKKRNNQKVKYLFEIEKN